jgi:hypothetical protein
MSRGRRKAGSAPQAGRSHERDRVLAGVAARLAEVTRLIRIGHWFAPSPGMDEVDWDYPDADDDGGLAPSGVRKTPPDMSGSGSAMLPEPSGDTPEH